MRWYFKKCQLWRVLAPAEDLVVFGKAEELHVTTFIPLCYHLVNSYGFGVRRK